MEPEDNPLPRRPAPRQPRLLPRAGRVPSWARGRSPMRTGRGHRRIPVPRRPGPGGCGPEGFWAVQEGGVTAGRGSSPVPGAYGYHNGGPSDWKGPLAEEGPSPVPSVGQRRAQGPVRGHSVPDPYHGAEAGEGWEEVALPPVSTSYSLPELPNLSEEERQCIMEVIRRDEHLRRQDDLRVMRLKAELQFLRRKGALRADWDPNSSGGGGGGSVQAVGGSPSSVISSAGIGLVGGLGSGLIGGGGGNGGGRACARCRAELGRIINRGAFCRACRLRVCKACREYNVRATDWVCSVCHKHMEIQVATGEWMNEFVRRPSRRRDNRVYVPASDIVKRSIRRSWTISTSHRRSFGGPQGSPELRAYSSLPRGASYLPAAAAEAAADAADAVAADTARRSADNRESPPHRRLPAHPLLYLLRRGSSSGSGSIGAGGSGDRHMDAVPTRRCVSQDEDVMPPMPMPLSRRDDGDSIFSSDKKFQNDSPGGSRRGIGRKGVSLRRQHAVSTGSAGSAGEVSSEGECFVPKSPRERKGSGGGGSGGGVDRFARALEKANSSRSSNDSSIQKVGRGESLERRSSKEKDASSSSDKEARQRPHQQKQQQQQQQQQKQRQQHHQRQPTEEEEEDDDEEEDPVEDFDVEPLSGTIFRKVTIKRKKKKKSVADEEVVAEGDDSGGGIGAGDAGQTTPSSASSTVAPSPSLVRSEKSLLHHHHAGELSRRLGAAAFTHDGTAPPYEAGGGSPAHAALLLDYVLDEGKIHPDGEDYKLVFISSDSSSKASTINSDEEEVPAEDCDWDYFEPARAVIVREMGDGGQSVVDPEEHVVVGGGGGGLLVRQLQHLSRSPLAASSPAASGPSPRSSLLPPGRKPLLPPDQHHLLTTPSTSPSPPKLPPATQSGTAGQAVAAKTPHHHVFRHHKQQRRFLQPKGVVETAATEGGEPGEVVSLADHIFFVEPMPAAVVADRQGSSLEGPPQTTPSQPPAAPTPQSSSSAVAARRARRRRARRVGRSRSETDLARLHLRLAPPPGEARLPGERSGSEGFVIDQGSSATTTILTASGGAGIRMWTLEREGGDQGRTIIPVPVPVPVPAWPHQQQHPQVFTLHDRADEIEIDLQGPAQGSSRCTSARLGVMQ
ncbi:uncharacterized protein LOC124161372 [Ischnura elegans]|uniref:uncharacterized protein LOC124161372 n=1 Tax=Ischnura elegans TaxID=197161 RepID=UPI001ED89289|nr:uncharacterized protein LOC124161372 [Ischnura elegans]